MPRVEMGRIQGAARHIGKPRRNISAKGLTTHYVEHTKEMYVSGDISTPRSANYAVKCSYSLVRIPGCRAPPQ